MRSNIKYVIAASILTVCLVIGAAVFIQTNTPLSERLQIIYIPKAKDDSIDFWTFLLEGAKMAAEEYDAELTILAPPSEDDYEAQIRYIDQAVALEPDAIILSPTSANKITEAANRIVTAGIRLVLVDSELDQNLQSVVVETDNLAAGREMGEYIFKRLPENPVIGVVAHVESSSTAIERLDGFKEGLGDKATHIVGTVYCDSNYDKAYRLTEELVRENPGINVLVGLNEYSAVGAARAVKDLGLMGDILMVGFDSSIEEVHMLEEGIFDAIVVQKPFNMGYLGVEKTVELLRGQTLPEVVDSGFALITKENMYTEENQKLLFPFWE